MKDIRDVIKNPRVYPIQDPRFKMSIDSDGQGGAFRVYSALGVATGVLNVIASTYGGWDHVSVSRKSKCPTWEQMEMVKRIFFHEHELAFQLHMPPNQHINIHPYTLHMWRSQSLDPALITPPRAMV